MQKTLYILTYAESRQQQQYQTNLRKKEKSKICHVSCVTCHSSCVICHLTPVTCHLSPVICHLSTTICSFTFYESPRMFCDAAARRRKQLPHFFFFFFFFYKKQFLIQQFQEYFLLPKVSIPLRMGQQQKRTHIQKMSLILEFIDIFFY